MPWPGAPPPEAAWCILCGRRAHLVGLYVPKAAAGGLAYGLCRRCGIPTAQTAVRIERILESGGGPPRRARRSA